MKNKIIINREHKDRLFRLLFGQSENKKNLLELYNALNDTNYQNPNDLEITTIDDVLYMSMKNDVSFLLEHILSLYEHQSTFNPNMPLRGLLYFGKLYAQYIETHKFNVYSKRQIKIPAPQYIVFYNGDDKHKDQEILKLSDAFEYTRKCEGFEWTATMLNINYGHNKTLMQKCHMLQEYAMFVDTLKQNRKQCSSLTDAVHCTVNTCINQGILREFLTKHKAEVIEMCLTEYNEAETMAAFREEFKEEWLAEGKAETTHEIAMRMLENNCDPVLILTVTKLSEQELDRIVKELTH